MVKWLLVLGAVAAVTWWASRPREQAPRPGRKANIKMTQCDKCGVYVEPGGACRCGDTSAGGGEK